MPRVLIIPDSFKGSATSEEVASYIRQGIRNYSKLVDTITLPVGDGGEGTVKAVTDALNGIVQSTRVTGPSGNKVTAHYGIIDQKTAIVELAETSGLARVEDTLPLSPFNATTYGLGELINYLLEQNFTHIYIGLGGSATNDGGVGMMQALGGEFLDKNGNPISFGNKGLASIHSINIQKAQQKLAGTCLDLLVDVDNPLTGPKGATNVFASQKGASKVDLLIMDQNMLHFQNIVKEQLNINFSDVKYLGAAGGTCASLWGFLKASIHNGIAKVLDLIHFDDYLAVSDLVITGEGRIDSQSLHGKASMGIANRAKSFDKPTIAIVGSIDGNIEDIYRSSIDLIIDIIHRPMALNEAIENTEELITNAATSAIRSYTLSLLNSV